MICNRQTWRSYKSLCRVVMICNRQTWRNLNMLYDQLIYSAVAFTNIPTKRSDISSALLSIHSLPHTMWQCYLNSEANQVTLLNTSCILINQLLYESTTFQANISAQPNCSKEYIHVICLITEIYNSHA